MDTNYGHLVYVILTSAPMLYVYTGLVLYGIHYICQKRQIDDERWYGTVHSAIQTVHAMGIHFGPAWLEAIEEAFEQHFRDQHLRAPTLAEIKMGVADAARLVGPQVLPIIGAVAMSKFARTNTALGETSIDNSTVPTQPVKTGAPSNPLVQTPSV